MPTDDDRRAELGAFLRSSRERLGRADFGLPPAGRGRTVGLRREEVSYLSGVSVTWYTWLEQGRDINPSRQVLDALSHTLRLGVPEHRYVLSLAGFAPLPARSAGDVEPPPPHLQRFLDAIGDNPAYALTAEWGIAGWNEAYQRLYPNVASTAATERNLLWVVFTDPAVRNLLGDWQLTSQRFLAEFRAEIGSRLGDPAILDLVARLSEASADFRAGWERHDIHGFESRERVFHHPEFGTVRYEHHQLRPSDQPEFQLVVYTRA
ncbi:helix-turn-helix transcriptional regulator [Mycolicibacterium sarraceniae]|uniref:Transcriptional regulator n=1 Tax=Mycolicibacterium sarraceniae TaxID=1534348 RepID=A0A7I7SVB0_9MYCO|nr:helix-turn-helix transcriptional regulator [Mycolicibacterium sarraceniae]BBY60957.1 transcriptional regulator [Mycolicibacterium sarraceniae]